MATSETSASAYMHESALLDRAFTRAAGAPLVSGNGVRLLKNAAANYPAWLEAIHSARAKVYFENYFICDDHIGREFASALAERARAGVRVCLVHDWLGSIGKASRRFWRTLTDAGVEVRTFNPLKFTSPMDVLHRDHRKVLAVDSRIGFVTGLCVGDMWVGDEKRNIAPWRDTGVQIEGPAVADVEHAFARVWATVGAPIPEDERRRRAEIDPVGDTRLRVISDEPGTAGLLRLDQFIASAARRSLWITDAYFAGTPPYVQALRAAALDGVDVRLLVPGSSDIPALQPFSRAGFRALLEAGIRVFEWKGPMLHAKTAVCDGQWARVGSTNLNVVSWLGNYELDVALEDARFAGQMEEMYLQDLENSTELVLAGRRLRSAVPRPPAQRMPRKARGSAGRAAAGALRVGNTVTAAISERRTLESGERRMVLVGGLALLTVAALWAVFPRVLGFPVALLLGWLALSLLWKAWRLRRPAKTASPASLPSVHDGPTAVAPSASARRSASLRGDAPG